MVIIHWSSIFGLLAPIAALVVLLIVRNKTALKGFELKRQELIELKKKLNETYLDLQNSLTKFFDFEDKIQQDIKNLKLVRENLRLNIQTISDSLESNIGKFSALLSEIRKNAPAEKNDLLAANSADSAAFLTLSKNWNLISSNIIVTVRRSLDYIEKFELDLEESNLASKTNPLVIDSVCFKNNQITTSFFKYTEYFEKLFGEVDVSAELEPKLDEVNELLKDLESLILNLS